MVWRTLRCVRRAIEVGRVPFGHGGVYVCGISGLGIGPDVSVVVRVDESLD